MRWEPLSLWILARWVWGMFIQAASHSMIAVNISNFLGASSLHVPHPLPTTSACRVRTLHGDPSFPAASYSKGAPYPVTLGRDKKSHKWGKRHSLRTAASLPPVWVWDSSLFCWVSCLPFLILWPQSVTEEGHCCPCAKMNWKLPGRVWHN